MEKRFRDHEGNEIVAQNEIQADAFRESGFKAVKGSANHNMEFAEDVDLGTAAKQMQANQQATADAQANATANASTPGQGAYATEFSQELGAMSPTEATEGTASKTVGKTNKKNNQ